MQIYYKTTVIKTEQNWGMERETNGAEKSSEISPHMSDRMILRKGAMTIQ